MKKKIGYLLSLCLLLGGTIYAETIDPMEVKMYVAPKAIHVESNGIFLELGDHFIPVKVVSSDERGVYVLGYECVRMVRCPRLDCLRLYDADNQSSICPHGYFVQCSKP